MNGVIPVEARHVGPDVVQTISARDLHAFLGVATAFKDWIARRLADYNFEDGQDFCSYLSESQGGRPAREYALTLDTAKELAMVERTDKGRQARQYFIECERRAKANVIDINSLIADPAQLRAALLAYTERVVALEAKVQEQAPKAEFHDAVAEAVNAQTVQAVAKVLGLGPNRFFKLLRDEGLLMENNLPMQHHLDAGRFRVIERQFTDRDGESRTYTRTLITGRGLTYIQQRLAPKPKRAA